MIFVLETYIKNQKVKRNKWEQDCQAWVKSKNSMYYREQEYEANHPRPGRLMPKVLAIVVPILAVVFVLISLIVVGVQQHKNRVVDPNNPNDCHPLIHKGDKVAVTYGDFNGSKGIAINQHTNCSVDLTLTNSTNSTAQARKDGVSTSGTLDNGDVLYVNTDNNIVKL